MLDNLDLPYHFNNNFKHSLKTIGLVSMGFVLIVLYFQPFGINFLKSENDGYFVLGAGFMNAATLFFNSTILPGIFPRIFASSRWTVRKEIFWNIWLFFNLFSLFVLMAWLARRASFAELPLFRTGLLSLLPLVLYNLVNYNMNLRTRVVNVFESGKNWLKEEREVLLTQSVNKIKIVAENGKDVFEERIENVLFIHSSGNYIEIFSIDNHLHVKKRLFRQTLANVERFLKDFEEFKKCHRSWMVNVSKIVELKGNSKGYSFRFAGTDLLVPVSRNFFASFRERFPRI